MLPDPWTLALAAVVVLAGPESPTDASGTAPAESAAPETPAPAEPAPAEPPPEAPPAEAAPAEAPASDPTPAVPTDGAPSEGVASFPDDAPAEPRTWNDPTAATAAAAATPSPAQPLTVEDDLGDEPLEPIKGKDPEGFGMAMVGAITISPDSGHAWAHGGCPSATLDSGVIYAPGCTATPAAGVSAEGRFGYMFNVGGQALGFDIYGQIASDYVNARLDQVPAIPGVPEYATQMHLGRIGIGGGAHFRYKTPPSAFRFSTGVGGGFLFRSVFSNVSSLDGSSEDYVAPVLRADVGVVIVSALTFGIMGWIEFANTVSITPDLGALAGAGDFQNALTETVVVAGTQGFIGLFGGFAFGK